MLGLLAVAAAALVAVSMFQSQEIVGLNTFGDRDVEPVKYAVAVGTTTCGSLFNAPKSGEIESISFLADPVSWGLAATVSGQIYSDNNGELGVLLGSTPVFNVTGGWNTLKAFNGGVESGGRYWVAVTFTVLDGTLNVRTSSLTTGRFFASNRAPAYSGQSMSIYAEYGD